MSVPARRRPALPEVSTYRVDIPQAEVLTRLEADPRVAMVKRFPPRSRSQHRFLAMRTPGGFRVIQNLGNTTLDGGPPVVHRFHLEAAITPTAEGASVQVSFVRGPQLRQLNYLVLWGFTVTWLLVTGVTSGKLGLVALLFALTAPALVRDRRKAAGAPSDRLELLNLMESLLGPALIGESPAEKTPYRDGHPPLPPAAESP
ncbi:MAG: hypothetical protein R3A79_11310 [Nannocystaceae bacterium]